MKKLSDLRVKLFADSADKASMLELAARPHIRGFTTNPTLMRKAGVTDYRAFAVEVLRSIREYPVSFEVLADDFEEMYRQAIEISSWGNNVYVKIPVTNTAGVLSKSVVRRLVDRGIKVNVTALTTLAQTEEVLSWVAGGTPSTISIFAGRVADTGRDPVPLMRKAVEMIKKEPSVELIWASPRELFNLFQADEVGCHILTLTPDLLAKVGLIGKDLGEYSLDTVKMFFNDGRAAGYRL